MLGVQSLGFGALGFRALGVAIRGWGGRHQPAHQVGWRGARGQLVVGQSHPLHPPAPAGSQGRLQQRITGRDHHQPIGPQGRADLTLGGGDRLAAAEPADVGGADVGDHGHVGLGATAQPLDFTEAPHPHLHHQRTGGDIGLQQGERGPHIVVFVAAAGHHRPQAGQGGADQFAGGGLAGRTRHGHHRHSQLAAPEAAEFLIGQQRVVHKPHGPAEGNHSLKLLGAQAVALGHGGGGPAG